MGKAALKNPRVVTVTDPIFGPHKEVQVDLFDVERRLIYSYDGIPRDEVDVETLICVISLGEPAEKEE